MPPFDDIQAHQILLFRMLYERVVNQITQRRVIPDPVVFLEKIKLHHLQTFHINGKYRSSSSIGWMGRFQ